MDTTMSSAAALQLVNPWHVTDVEFRDTDAGGREPRIMIVFAPGSRFHCPEAGCGEEVCPVYDTMERTWCHLNFFQYKAFIHAGVPRVACPEHGVRTVPVPWARPGGGVRAPVRGDGRGTGEKPAGRGHRRTGRRARHETVAVHPPLRGRGAPVRGLHGRGDDRHRRDQPQGTPVHHRRRRPDGAQRDLRGAGQGLDHDETVRGRFHGAKRRPEPRAPGDVRHERDSPRASATTCPTRPKSSTSSMSSNTPTRPSTRSVRPRPGRTRCSNARSTCGPGTSPTSRTRSWRSSAIWRSGGRRPPGRAGCANACRTSTPTAPAARRRRPSSGRCAHG